MIEVASVFVSSALAYKLLLTDPKLPVPKKFQAFIPHVKTEVVLKVSPENLKQLVHHYYLLSCKDRITNKLNTAETETLCSSRINHLSAEGEPLNGYLYLLIKEGKVLAAIRSVTGDFNELCYLEQGASMTLIPQEHRIGSLWTQLEDLNLNGLTMEFTLNKDGSKALVLDCK